MSEIDNREQELLNPELTDEQIDEILNTETEEDNSEGDEEQDDALKAELAKKDAIIRQLHARAKKAEADRKNFDKPIIKKQQRRRMIFTRQ